MANIDMMRSGIFTDARRDVFEKFLKLSYVTYRGILTAPAFAGLVFVVIWKAHISKKIYSGAGPRNCTFIG